MPCTVYVFFVATKSKNPIHKFVAGQIRKVEKLGLVNHMAIGIEYEDEMIIYHSVFPKPVSERMTEFLINNEPILIYKREVRNERHMFKMLMWLSIKGSHAYYGMVENVMIWFKRRFSQLKEVINTIKTNHDEGLNCTEYGTKFLAWSWPQDFTIERNEDSLGLREAVDACNKSLLLLNDLQMKEVCKPYQK